MKILVIADERTALAFALAGIKTCVVKSGIEIPSILEKLTRVEVSLVLITDLLAEENREAIGRALFHPERPLILEIPGMSGTRRQRTGLQDRVLSLVGR
jgi:V/A-type H+/Na+-transporting ATPase subunit F